MEMLKMEKSNLKQAFIPADLNGSGATGERVSLAEGFRCAVVLSAGDSTGAGFTVSFQQHDAASGGNSKALNVQVNYYHKVGAATSFTKVELRPDDAGLSDSVDLATQFANDEGIVVFEFLPEHLDAENDFSYLSVNIADPAAAKVVAGVYDIHNVKDVPAYSIDL